MKYDNDIELIEEALDDYINTDSKYSLFVLLRYVNIHMNNNLSKDVINNLSSDNKYTLSDFNRIVYNITNKIDYDYYSELKYLLDNDGYRILDNLIDNIGIHEKIFRIIYYAMFISGYDREYEYSKNESLDNENRFLALCEKYSIKEVYVNFDKPFSTSHLIDSDVIVIHSSDVDIVSVFEEFQSWLNTINGIPNKLIYPKIHVQYANSIKDVRDDLSNYNKLYFIDDGIMFR